MKNVNVLILGESGSGKSRSVKNLDPKKTFWIQSHDKLPPFKSGLKNYTKISKANPDGNLLVSTNRDVILRCIAEISKRKELENIIYDDFQGFMSNNFMAAIDERGFEKFTRIGKHTWEIINALQNAPQNTAMLSHIEKDDGGKLQMKTQGKLVRQNITPEGLFTIVLYTKVEDGRYSFTTQSDGYNTAKSPEGMFEIEIENDLQIVFNSINEYYK